MDFRAFRGVFIHKMFLTLLNICLLCLIIRKCLSTPTAWGINLFLLNWHLFYFFWFIWPYLFNIILIGDIFIDFLVFTMQMIVVIVTIMIFKFENIILINFQVGKCVFEELLRILLLVEPILLLEFELLGDVVEPFFRVHLLLLDFHRVLEAHKHTIFFANPLFWDLEDGPRSILFIYWLIAEVTGVWVDVIVFSPATVIRLGLQVDAMDL